ncbi:hypothetical protein JCM9279_005706 [Rhodotorula babjevae]
MPGWAGEASTAQATHGAREAAQAAAPVDLPPHAASLLDDADNSDATMASSGDQGAETSFTRPRDSSRSTARKCAPNRAPLGAAAADASDFFDPAVDDGRFLGDDSSSESSSTASDSSIEFDSGASSHDPRATPPAARPLGPALPIPTPFRTAARPARARQHVQVGATSPPKTARAVVDPAAVSRDHPLPHPLLDFNILNHAPARHPAPPPGWKELSSRTVQEEVDEAARGSERRRRVEEQRRLREPEGARWDWTWACDGLEVPKAEAKGKGKGKTKEASPDFHSAAFFPHAHLPGLEYMSGVIAIVGGSKVDLCYLDSASTSSSPAQLSHLVSHTSAAKLYPSHVRSPRPALAPLPPADPDPPSQRDKEEYLTCAWSVNITTHPYTPMLAVAGRGRVVDVFLVGRRASGEWLLYKDRTITGHGGTILHLAFHPSYPHLLASASEDKTIRLWDPTLPWGSDVAVSRRVRDARPGSAVEMGTTGGGKKGGKGKVGPQSRVEERIRQAEGGRTSRPRVEGELLGVLAEGGHEKAVMSCDFHATLPIIVSAGNDGFIKLWQLPPAVLEATPFWPRTPLHHHPASPPPFAHAPIIDPPIFSSYAVHPGQWTDQVLFASPTTCTILSKAAVTHPDAAFSPRTSVKLWSPTVLDVLPSCSADRRAAAVERARRLDLATPEALGAPALLPPSAVLPPYARSDGAFRVLYEAVVESQNCVGDSVGWYRPAPRSPVDREQDGPSEAFFVLGTATPLPAPAAAVGADEALYFFRPFSPIPLGPDARPPTTSSSSAAPFAPIHSTSRTPSATRRPPSAAARAAEVAAAARALFPPERDRSAHDFTPRLLPSAVVDVFTSSGGERAGAGGRRAVHWRALAVSARGTEVVAVGDGGAVAVFRAQLRDGDEV